MMGIFHVLLTHAGDADGRGDFPGLIDLHGDKPIQKTNTTDSSPVADPQVGLSSTTPISTHGLSEAIALTTSVSAHGLSDAITPTNPTFLLGSPEAPPPDQVPLSERLKRRQDESEDQELPASKRVHLPPPEHVLRQ
ncbi:hypothetical protein P691DRAFT_214219 [Macrolepiota fuliginosa MF-IS2]|uniref:Uncharacterized protein n=1 Tax=Macrolepiota fuliginosa MF-IS2 TaxID=1400762 RepID=A0A9P5WXX4_9AGAR|nr:hypothetical protein P691DRAFT_214219 [Macrolepiota fuliginosa MF-IS2]